MTAAERLEQIITNHIDQLEKSTRMMENGKLFTTTNGRDTTDESISDNMVLLGNLERALENLRLMKGGSGE
jgi:hypothetical protein